MTSGRPTPQARNQWLDVLRGLAIFGVVAVHTVQYSDYLVARHGGHPSTLVTNTLSHGRYGVELFFFLSGWLLTSIYGVSGRSLGRSYWIRRAARILPLWILFLAVEIIRSQVGLAGGWATALGVAPGESPALHSPITIVFLTLTFTLWISASLWNTVIPGGWSIQAEVGHYLLFPVLRKHGLRRVIKWASYCNLLTYFCYQLSISSHQTWLPKFVLKAINAWVRFDLFATFGYFALGVISFCAYSEYRRSGKIELTFNKLNISLNSLILFLVSFLIVPLDFGNQPSAIGYVLLMLLFSGGIYRLVYLRKFFVFLGKYSYFIYFCHFQIIFAIDQIVKNQHFALNYEFSQTILFILLFSAILGISSLIAIPSF